MSRPGVREYDEVGVGDRVLFLAGPFKRSGLVKSCDPVGTVRGWCEDESDDCGRYFELVDCRGEGEFRGYMKLPADNRWQMINECQIYAVEMTTALEGMLF